MANFPFYLMFAQKAMRMCLVSSYVLVPLSKCFTNFNEFLISHCILMSVLRIEYDLCRCISYRFAVDRKANMACQSFHMRASP